MKTLSQLIGRVEPGTDAGTCYLCGERTERGHRRQLSKDFTAWAQTYGGDCICEHCLPMIADKSLRTHSWIATPGNLLLIDSANRHVLYDALLNPPDPPFAIYLTRAGKKQGYLRLMRYISTSRRLYYVGTDWTDAPVLVARDQARALGALVEQLQARGAGVTAMVSGQFPTAVWRKAIEAGWEHLLREAMRYAGNPVWEVIVRACARAKRDAD